MSRKIKNTDTDEEVEAEEEKMIKVEENRVYFHAEVTRENCFKLIECIQKAQEYIAIRSIKNEFEDTIFGIKYSRNGIVKFID